MLLLLLLLGTRSASAAAGHTHKPEGPETPQCEQVFLGDDIGYANIFEYHEEDGTCQLSMSELAAVCTGDLFASCMAFVEGAQPERENNEKTAAQPHWSSRWRASCPALQLRLQSLGRGRMRGFWRPRPGRR